MRRVMAAAPSLDEAAAALGIDPSTLYRKRKGTDSEPLSARSAAQEIG